MTYFDKLRAASVARDSLLCIGLDPEPAVIAGGLDGAVDFCRSLVERTSDLACCYEPNAAFWEQYGPRGWEGLATVRRSVPPDLPVLRDAPISSISRPVTGRCSSRWRSWQCAVTTPETSAWSWVQRRLSRRRPFAPRFPGSRS